MHVLEHLPDPVKFLQELRQRYLYPQGGLLLEVPNLYVHESFEVAHLSAFSVHTLAQTVHKAGFRREALWTHGLPRSRIFPLYITLLARPAVGALTDGSPHREPGMRIKRYTGMFFRRSFERLFPGLAWLPFPEYKADHSQG
jgi:hypothetical protein